MTHVYYRRSATIATALVNEGVVLKSDDHATLHYYGTTTLSRALSEAELERFNMEEADEGTIASETEAEALYRAETGFMR